MCEGEPRAQWQQDLSESNSIGAMADERCVAALDPHLWQELPLELLDRVLSKLPFSSLVTFRTVSKLWNFVIIPRAAAPLAQFATASVLLYFDCVGSLGPKKPSRVWFSELWNSKRSWASRPKNFQPSSFPAPRVGEYVRLVASEGGLLFFTFVKKISSMVRDIVVCNPLTGLSRSLCLPSSFQFPFNVHPYTQFVLIGVAVNVENGNYKLVAVGVDERDVPVTLIYDSLTFTWKNSSPVQLKDPADLDTKLESVGRSVCCNDNLYWYATMTNVETRPKICQRVILKYDLENDLWNITMLDDGFECVPYEELRTQYFSQIALCSGQVMLLHVHQLPRFVYKRAAAVNEFDCPIWKQRSDLPELGPDMKLMTHEMIHEIEGFLVNDYERGRCKSECVDYFMFGNQDLRYHVLLRYEVDGDKCFGKKYARHVLRIAVQNTSNNSYTWLPAVEEKTFLGLQVTMDPTTVWAFSPTFNSV